MHQGRLAPSPPKKVSIPAAPCGVAWWVCLPPCRVERRCFFFPCGFCACAGTSDARSEHMLHLCIFSKTCSMLTITIIRCQIALGITSVLLITSTLTNAMQCGAMPYDWMRLYAMQFSEAQRIMMRCGAVQCNCIRRDAMRSDAMQINVTQYIENTQRNAKQ